MYSDETEPEDQESDVSFVGFALSECTVETDCDSARYVRAVHRTALELAVQYRFGIEVGGFWMLPEQIDQLRKLPDCYPPNEAPHVTRAVDAFLRSQLQSHYFLCSTSETAQTKPASCEFVCSHESF